MLQGGGRTPPTPTRSPSVGGGFFYYYIFLRQSKFYIALHCTHPRLRQEIKYILIHNNTLQSFVWSNIALNIHVYHFEN